MWRSSGLVAMVIGPGNLLVAAKVHFVDECSATDIEPTAHEAEMRLRSWFPGVRYVFLGPNPVPPKQPATSVT